MSIWFSLVVVFNLILLIVIQMLTSATQITKKNHIHPNIINANIDIFAKL